MKALSKDEEIKLLTQLVEGDGYFAQSFSKDLSAMIENIRNDFEITCGITLENVVCELNDKINDMKKETAIKIVQAVEAEKSKTMSLIEKIVCMSEYPEPDELYKTAVDAVGLDEVIKIKHRCIIRLTEKEITYLVSKL